MNKTYIINDSFVDFLGNYHPFTVAAVLTNDPAVDILDANTSEYITDCIARLGIGVAVCNPMDIWDAEKGAHIAEGRARKYWDDVLLINSKAMLPLLTDEAINTMLKEEAKYVKEHIGIFIPGYDEMVKKHKDKEAEKKIRENLSEQERTILDVIEKDEISADCKALIKKAL